MFGLGPGTTCVERMVFGECVAIGPKDTIVLHQWTVMAFVDIERLDSVRRPLPRSTFKRVGRLLRQLELNLVQCDPPAAITKSRPQHFVESCWGENRTCRPEPAGHGGSAAVPKDSRQSS